MNKEKRAEVNDQIDWFFAIETAFNEVAELGNDHEAEEFFLMWYQDTRDGGREFYA